MHIRHFLLIKASMENSRMPIQIHYGGIFGECGKSGLQRTIRTHDKRSAVKYQLILSTNCIHVDYRAG